MSLERKTPMKRVRSKPRRVPAFTCSIRGCNTAPRYFPYCGKHARKEADRLFSLYIRARDRGCRMCTDRTNLQCAHLISRRYFAVRWEPENAVALCAGHHKQFTEDPLAWEDWCLQHLGVSGWANLKLRARLGGMPDLAYTIAELRAMLKEVAA